MTKPNKLPLQRGQIRRLAHLGKSFNVNHETLQPVRLGQPWAPYTGRRRLSDLKKARSTMPSEIQPWHVMAMAPVRLSVAQWYALVKTMAHMTTTTVGRDTLGGALHGQTVWAGEAQGQQVILTWGWAEATADSIAISDPMVVLSNVEFEEQDGASGCSRLLHLNNAIHVLPWQPFVTKHQRPDRTNGTHNKLPNLPHSSPLNH